MKDALRILSLAMLPLAAALAGCSVFDAWDKGPMEPTPPQQHAAVQNPDRTSAHVDRHIPPPPDRGHKPPPPPDDVVKPPADAVAAAHFKDLMGRALTKALDATDMSCRLTRTEMVNGVLQKEEVLDFKQRFTPHSLRIKWVGERNKGRDLIYVKGQNDDKVLVKEPGLAGLLTGGKPQALALDSVLLKAQSRYTPDVVGYDALVKRIATLYKDARPLGLVWVAEKPSEMVAGRRLQTFELSFEAVLLDVDIKRILVTFDLAEALPVHTVTYDAKDRLVEDYHWDNLRLNVSLTDADFRFE